MTQNKVALLTTIPCYYKQSLLSFYILFSDDIDQIKQKCNYYKESLFKKEAENAKLRQKLSRQKKDLLKQKREIRKQQEKIKGLLQDIEKQKLLDSEKTKELLNSISNSLAFKLIKREKRPQKYDMEVKTFAHTLRFYSPKGYEFARKYLELPEKSTLNKDMRSFECMPGFISESFEELKSHKGDSNYGQASCVIDGIHLKELVEYCPDLKGQIFGNVNYGPNADDYGESYTFDERVGDPANEAVVVMLVGLKVSLIRAINIFYIFINVKMWRSYNSKISLK